MERNFNSAVLPDHCYAVLPGSGQLIEVRRGEKGYYPCAYSTGDRAYNEVLANQFNAHEGISKAQAAAMLAGSMAGMFLPPILPTTMQRVSRSSRKKRKHLSGRRNISTNRQNLSGKSTSPEARLYWMRIWKIRIARCPPV